MNRRDTTNNENIARSGFFYDIKFWCAIIHFRENLIQNTTWFRFIVRDRKLSTI